MNIEIGASGVAIIWVAAIPVPSLKVDAAGGGHFTDNRSQEDVENSAAAAELATIELSSAMLERIAEIHQPPREWYDLQEDKPF